ncbi:MAG: GMC family oxidoreductase [Chitinophagaceae bacterium]|nr:GMC family oxidoreductase [Oligoflexus sp.]
MPLYPIEKTVDVIIIGSGAGGAPLASRLAKAGLKVVVLEAGPRWNANTDFATDERSQTKLFWKHERISEGQDPTAFGSNNSGSGVGGSTLHYTAYTPRPQPDDLRLHSEFGLGNDWPLSFETLEPYMEEVEQFLGISGPSPYPWGPKRNKAYSLPPLPLNGPAQLMQRGCEKLGITTSPAANAALSGPLYIPGVGWRPACTNRGYCQAGCSTGAKASMDVTFLPMALKHGAEIRPDAFVLELEKADDGSLCAVRYLQHSRIIRQRTGFVFLSAGGIESPRLLMLNKLANSSGQVGRNFMAHPGPELWGIFDEDVRPNKGIPGGLISEDMHRAGADFAGGYLLQSIGVMPVTYASQLVRGKKLWGRSLGEHMKSYNSVAGINILGDCLPYAGNGMTLSKELDDLGLPKPVISFSYGENERRMIKHAIKTMTSIWESAGATSLWSFQRSAHTIGMCRMGEDAANSVVSSRCQSHDIPNLFIVDNSVFPSALSVNPALTIMSLSLYCAASFLADQGCSSLEVEQ